MTGWTKVGQVEDVPMLEGRRVTVAGRRIAVFRTEAGVHAIDADCPHQGGPLQDGLVAGACVTCPLHNWRFSLATGAPVAGGDRGVTVHDVRVAEDGALWLRPATEALPRAA